MTSIIQGYNWIIHESSDHRVKQWFLMDGPAAVTSILLLYLYLIKIRLPEWMKHKEAYNLKTVIKYYNIFQIIANSYIFCAMGVCTWENNLNLGCKMPNYSTNSISICEAVLMHQFFIMKLIELIETVFFVLRKKDKQASFLHIYHHVITVCLMWMGTKYIAGGMTTVPVMLNSFVHIVMYAYYYLTSTTSPETRKILNEWKSSITILQMIQFTAAIVHGLQAGLICKAPITYLFLYLPNVVVVYYLFYDFFNKAYSTKQKNKLT